MRNTIIIFSLLLTAFGVLSFTIQKPEALPSETVNSDTRIEWLDWEEAIQRSQTEKRKVMVDVYTDWCGWCKRMDKATFCQPQIVKYVNEKYYAIKFNAEYKGDISFKGKTYKYVNNGRRGYHELAAEIMRGRLSYPTVVFLNENMDVIQPVPGFKDPLEFEQIITYFGRDEHRKTPWDNYRKAYVPLSKE